MMPALLSLAIFGVALYCIVTDRVDRTIAAVLGAAAVVFTGLVPYEYAIARVDLNVIFLLVGMMVVVNLLADTGLFEWVAVAIAKGARGNATLIVLGLLAATAVLSAFLDNVTTVVLIAPITILITQILEINAVPILILEALFSNIGGTATLIGDPPNILIGSKAHLGFVDFLEHLTPVIVVLGLLSLAAVPYFFAGSFKTEAAARARILRAEPRLAILDPVLLRRGLVLFFALLAGFVASHSLHLEPGLIALAGAMIMLLVCRQDLRTAMEKVEWNTLFFLIGLFMLVSALEYNGIFAALGRGMVWVTRGNLAATVIVLLWFSGILSAAAGSLPVVLALLPLTQTLYDAFAAQGAAAGEPEHLAFAAAQPLFWALALGTCLGGNGTLFGAAANVVTVQIAARNGYHVPFKEFSRYGLPLTAFSLAVSTVYLYLRYFLLA